MPCPQVLLAAGVSVALTPQPVPGVLREATLKWGVRVRRGGRLTLLAAELVVLGRLLPAGEDGLARTREDLLNL